MARLYFDMKVNAPDTNDKYPTPSLNLMTFRHPDKDISMSVSCNWESDYGIEDGVFSGRFKGLETSIEGDDAENHEWAEMNEKDFEFLKDMQIESVNIYVDSVTFKNPLHVNDVNVEIVFTNEIDSRIKFYAASPVLDVDGEYSANAIVVDNAA